MTLLDLTTKESFFISIIAAFDLQETSVIELLKQTIKRIIGAKNLLL
jgi:hypothetical protein